LTKGDRAELTRKLRHNENAVWQSTPEIADAFRNLSEGVLRWREPLAESHMLSRLNQLLLGILTVLSNQAAQENPELASRRRTVELFLHDLAANAASSGQPWTLAEMATQCGMGITAFTQYARELVNNGPVEFLNQCRLDHAARQLKKNPTMPVTEIAFQHGFNSSQYFATCFRRRFRMAPSAFRSGL
jgi:AraC family L-rhamnose operon regulatory protein RhaS